jgi:hypothetical protein
VMMYAEFVSYKPCKWTNQDGVSFQVGPSFIYGNLQCTKLEHAGVNPDDEEFSVTLDFRTKDSACWRYSNILSAGYLMPDKQLALQTTAEELKPEIVLSATLDYREDFSITLPSGEVRTIRLKYTPAEFKFQHEREGLLVQLALSDLERDTILRTRYQKPYANLVWRSAPEILSDHIGIESQEFVSVVPVQEALDLPVSDVEIIS